MAALDDLKQQNAALQCECLVEEDYVRRGLTKPSWSQ